MSSSDHPSAQNSSKEFFPDIFVSSKTFSGAGARIRISSSCTIPPRGSCPFNHPWQRQSSSLVSGQSILPDGISAIPIIGRALFPGSHQRMFPSLFCFQQFLVWLLFWLTRNILGETLWGKKWGPTVLKKRAAFLSDPIFYPFYQLIKSNGSFPSIPSVPKSNWQKRKGRQYAFTLTRI